MQNQGDVLDYAIVGGGVSGVYSGMRLMEDSGNKLNIGLFELSGRIGGRLLSVVPPGIKNARVELGGMRYIKGRHLWVTDLVEHLGFETESLAADEPQNIAYVRGHLLRMRELSDSAKVPYNLEQGESRPNDLANLTAFAAKRALKSAIKEVLRHDIDLANLKAAQWETLAKKGSYEGSLLFELPMRYLMARSMSHEALSMAQDVSGYDSILHTWNAADGFPWNLGDYGPDVTYLHVKDGYEQIPLTLAERFENAGGSIQLNTRLASFDVDGSEGLVTLQLEAGGEARTVVARNLILAMPRRSLELLDQTGPVLEESNAEVHELIQSVTPIPLFKLAICYESAWWENLPPADSESGQLQKISQGKSVTDLPIRQCYYWAVDPDTHSAVVLIYDDGVDLDYWAGLRDSKATPFPNDPRSVSGETRLPSWSQFPAPKRMVEEAHRQLVEMHGNPADVPAPYSAAYRDWGEDPFGGGANFWPAGVKSYEVSTQIIQPKPPYPVYICGDAYSHAQGWVEGALATAEEMLQDHLGLKRPSWATTS